MSSSARLQVKVGDVILHGSYSGTADVCRPRLFRIASDVPVGVPGQLEDYYVRDQLVEMGKGEPAIIATDYGGGFWWEGTADVRHCSLVTGIEPHGSETQGGTPIEPRLPITDGLPDWWVD